jgi:hypothetical protein
MKTPFTLQTTTGHLFFKHIKKGLVVSLFFLFALQTQAQLASWNAASLSGGGPSPWAATTTAANITVGGLTRGAGLGSATAGSAWGANNWTGAANQDAFFTVTANAGYMVSFSSMSMAYRRSGTGPGTGLFQFAYGAASTSYTTIATLSYPNSTSTTGVPLGPVSMGAVAELQNVPAGTVVKFRIFNTGGASAGTWYMNSANALSIAGTVVAVPSCTTPTGLAASNVGTNSAELNWNAITGVSGYQYVIDQTAAAPAGTGTAVATNSFTASSLATGTAYYAHVRTDCGGTFSGWATTSFTTANSCISPTVTAITGNTAVCIGQDLNLSITAIGTALNYTWTGAGSFSSPSVSSPTVMNAASSTYTVDVANACGTASTVVNVTVNALPPVSANTATVCPAGTATLTATGATTYTWSTTQTTSGITVNPVTATSYTVSGTDMNGCTNTFTTSVSVYTLPVVGANSASVCPGSTATLTATGANTYTWSTMQSASSVTVNPTGTTSYTVIGTDMNGCTNTFTTSVSVYTPAVISVNSPSICAGNTAILTAIGAATYTWSTTQTTVSISVNPATTTHYTVTGTDINGCVNAFTNTVTVNALPPVSANSPSVCPGGTATLTATGATTYTWSTTQSATSITVTPAATSHYTVSGTDVNGCINAFSNTVTVNALPPVSANSASVCPGGTATLTASGAATYTWSTSQSAVSVTVSPTMNTTYTVNGTDLNGCSNSYTTMVTMTSSPSITVGSASVCAGKTATLTAAGVTSYTWNTGSNSSTMTASPSATTVYTVSGQLTGCPVTATQTATITVNPLPSVSISTISSIICNTSSTVNLVGSPAGGSFSGTGISGNVFSPQSAGTGTFTISYTYTASSTCSNIAHSSIVVNNCTGIEEASQASYFNVYPNPAQDVLYIAFDTNASHTVQIYNTAGSLVYSETVSETLHAIRTAELSKGLYIINITGPEGTISKKILVQ